MRAVLLLILNLKCVISYWDLGTTTERSPSLDEIPRQSFFRWQKVESDRQKFWNPDWDWDEMWYRRNLCAVAGISIDFIPLSTATILNRRTVISAANWVEPYLDRQRDLRIWALGRGGQYMTPYRYRVWRVQRLFPRSLNPEHMHGPRGYHVPRHDISIIHSLDQIYIYYQLPTIWMYPYRATLTKKHDLIAPDQLWFSGSGYETLDHILENYKIFYLKLDKEQIVDCSIYLPKWWGKFICVKNTRNIAGLQNGGGLFTVRVLVGIGCFEIRYNEDKIFVFTDLRYYVDFIYSSATIYPGEYYEYAYSQWFIRLGWLLADSSSNNPYIPAWQIKDDLYPLGKK